MQAMNDQKNECCKIMHFDEEGWCELTKGCHAPIFALKMGMATATAIEQGQTAVVGYGDGTASYALANCFVAGLSSAGVRAMLVGKTTPAQTMYATKLFSAEIGCFVSAENSFKIKIADKCGVELERNREQLIEQAFNSRCFRQISLSNYGEIVNACGVKLMYRDYLNSMLPNKFSGINVEIRTYDKLAEKIVDWLFQGRNDADGERIIFQLSSDGSACSAYSDKTGCVFHERLMLIAIKSAFGKKIPVAVSDVFPKIADKLAQEENGKLYRYRFNSPKDAVARKVAMRRDNFFVRDGLALICTVLGFISEKGMSFYKAVEEAPYCYSSQQFMGIRVNGKELIGRLVSDKNADEAVFERGVSRVRVRQVKDGSGIMIYSESFNSETATAFCDEIKQRLKRAECDIT